MNKEDQEYYERQLDMFLHPGWQYFVGQVQGMRDSLDTLSGVTRETLGNRQGQLEMVNWILGWPETLQKAYEELQKEDADI